MCIHISARDVKELRSKTGAGMMNCKKALLASKGDMLLALEDLRKQGLASASKKSQRITAEGIVESYIHAGCRIGVLLELNCETDFVARHKEFRALAKNLAMQVAACPDVQYVSTLEIPENIIAYEKSIEMDKKDLKEKPDDIKKSIVKGRIDKRMKELALMSQSFIREPNLLISDLIDQKIALLGENIKVRRFKKFILGEGIEKKEPNLSQDVSQILNK